MSDSDAPSEDLSSDEEDMNEPISLPAPSNFSPSSSTNTNNNTIINKAKSTPLEIPDYPHRCCCLLHKWNKYEPTVFCINKNGIALYDWSQTVPTLQKSGPMNPLYQLHHRQMTKQLLVLKFKEVALVYAILFGHFHRRVDLT